MTSAYAADPVFETNARQISYLIQRTLHRELALPDFQRDFVWETKRTVELLQSVMCRFPTGTLLFWKQSEQGFAERAIEGAPDLAGKRPDELVLDGQQRLTSLFRALTNASSERYFIRLKEFSAEDGRVLHSHEIDFERALFVVDGVARLPYDPEDRVWQFEEVAFPLGNLDSFDEWLDAYVHQMACSQETEAIVKKRIRDVRDAYLLPLRSYGFPVVTLPASTPLEAVCNIFETLNRTGKPLGAFELLTARFYPRGVNLRDKWVEATDTYALLDEFGVDPYSLLQAVSLRIRNSAQRSDVLTKLTVEEFKQEWDQVVAGAADVLDLLSSSHGVLDKRWLPYGALLIPMAASWPDIKALKPIERQAATDRVAQYFWCTTFTTNFDQGGNSQAGADFIKLKTWLFDAGAEAPEAVQRFTFTEAALRSAVVRRKALHAGVMALTVQSGAKDFHTGQKLTPAKVKEKKFESHHIFPRAFLKAGDSELILNRALIDGETNRIIGRKAPSIYVADMQKAYGVEKSIDVLDSHSIVGGHGSGIESDDYALFLGERADAIIGLIEGVTGCKVERSA